MPDSSGGILRWIVELDGKEPLDMDVRIEPAEDPRWIVMSLVRDGEELVIGRWPRRQHPEGAQVLWNLGDLRRWGAERFRGT